LEAAWKEHCQTQDRIILADQEAKGVYIYQLGKKLAQLNNEYHRCKPLEWSNYSPYTLRGVDDSDCVQFLGVNSVCVMAIWKEQETKP